MSSNREAEGPVSQDSPKSQTNGASVDQNPSTRYNPHWKRGGEHHHGFRPDRKFEYRNNRQGWQNRGGYRGMGQKRNRGWYRGRGRQGDFQHRVIANAEPKDEIDLHPNKDEDPLKTTSPENTAKSSAPKVELNNASANKTPNDNRKGRVEWNQQTQSSRVRKRNKFTGQNNNKSPPTSSIPSFVVDTNLSFEGQVVDIIRQVEQIEENRLNVTKVLNDLKHIFGPVLPDVQPQVFGSMLTDLAFTSSDLDAFLYCPSGQPEYNFIQKKGSLIYKGQKFINIVRLGHARVPVIKAHHVATGINVDITITSRVGVMNSLMLKFLVTKGDPRIRQLLMLNLLWSKLADVSGVNRLSSYTICLMTVFFLQQLEPCILPPLHTLVIPVDDLSWPMEFRDDPSLLHTTNTTQLKDLFREFFVFYSNFDFGNNVISPFSGKIIPCSSFVELDKLPECYEHYKKMHQSCDKKFLVKSFMHVQEPLDLTANTAHSVSRLIAETVNSTCSLVVDFLDSFIETTRLDLLFKVASKPVWNDRTARIKFAVPETDHDKLICALKVTFRDIFLIQMEEVGKGGTKQPRLEEENGSGSSWYTCTACSNPFCKSRNGVIRALATCEIPNFAKEMIISRYVICQWKRKYNFQALVHLKYSTDGTIDVNVVDTFHEKANNFKEIAEHLRLHLRYYVLLALKENSLNPLVSIIDKMFIHTKTNLNLSNLKEFVEEQYSTPTTTTNSPAAVDDVSPPEEKSLDHTNKFLECIERIAQRSEDILQV